MLYTNCVNSGKLPRVHSVATMAIVAGLTSTLAAFEPEPDTSTRAVCRLALPIAIDAAGLRPFDRSTLELRPREPIVAETSAGLRATQECFL
jgi:hypothetical protein